MTMDASAIKAICESTAIEQASTAVGIALQEAHGAAALPTEFHLHDLEKFLRTRRRMRGHMKTSSLDAFADFVGRHAEPGAAVFVNAERMDATAVLNLGDRSAPGHADMLATLSAKWTAAMAAMKRACAQPLTQQAAAEFLEDWRDMVECVSDTGAILPTAKTIAGLRKLTIETMRKLESDQQQLRATTSAFEDVQAKSVETLPTAIVFECEPSVFLSKRRFYLRLGIQTGGKEPTIMLRLAMAEQHEQDMAEEMRMKIAEALDAEGGQPVPMLLGTYQASA